MGVDHVEQPAEDGKAAQFLQGRIALTRWQEVGFGMGMPAVMVDQNVIDPVGAAGKADVPHRRSSVPPPLANPCDGLACAAVTTDCSAAPWILPQRIAAGHAWGGYMVLSPANGGSGISCCGTDRGEDGVVCCPGCVQ
jgi:hypothetical protein